jgi:hypothetical protein
MVGQQVGRESGDNLGNTEWTVREPVAQVNPDVLRWLSVIAFAIGHDE